MKKSLACFGFGSWLMVLLAAPVAVAGEGDPCTSDEDCGEGYTCGGSDDASPVPGQGGASSEDVDVVEDGECIRAVVVCQDDSDCPANFECSEASTTSGASVECDSAGNCTSEPAEPSVDQEEGICTAKPAECETDAECPAGSGCVEGICAFDLATCQEDSDCDSGYVCLIESEEVCTGSSSSCAAGEECVPEESESQCETRLADEGFCFPPPTECAEDSDCEGDDVCYDIPAAVPSSYSDSDYACWPPGLVGAVEGTVAVTLDGQLMETAEASDLTDVGTPTGANSSTDADSEDDDVADGDAAADDDGTAGAGGEDGAAGTGGDDSASDGIVPGEKKDDGGCSVARAAGSSRGSAAFGALLAMLALSAARRRQA